MGLPGPLDFTGLSGAAGQSALPSGLANAGASEANFAQMFEEALSIEDKRSRPRRRWRWARCGLRQRFAGRVQIPAVCRSRWQRQLRPIPAGQCRRAVLLQQHGPSSPPRAGVRSRPAGLCQCRSLAEWKSGAGVRIRGQPCLLAGRRLLPEQEQAFRKWMDAHALTRSSHHCAMYCRMGLEAAGLNTADRPQSGDAGDYGPFLQRHGAQVVCLPESYVPQVGDVVVLDKTDQRHTVTSEMYDGSHWVSDFKPAQHLALPRCRNYALIHHLSPGVSRFSDQGI